MERDARHEKRRQLQARLSEWDARLEYEERHQRELRAKHEREARLEDDDRERREWEVCNDSRFDRELGSMRLKHEPFQGDLERDTMFEPVRLDSDLHSQPHLDLDRSRGFIPLPLNRSDYRYVPARDWFQRDVPDVNSHRVFDEHQAARRDSRQPVQVTLEKPSKLDIIKFNGNPEQYPFFITQTREARQVHSDVKILPHLKTRLKGKAFDAVSASLLSGCTLVDVLSVLGKHFGNPKVVVQSVTRKLFNRPPIIAHHYQELAEFSIEVDHAQAVLRAIGYERELDNIQSMGRLVSKLPAHDADRWAEFGRKWESQHWPSIVSSVEFAKFLASLVEDRQFSRPTALSKSAQSVFRRQDNKQLSGARVHSTREVKQTAPAAISSAPATAAEPRKIQCYYCRGEHVITKCSTFAALSVK